MYFQVDEASSVIGFLIKNYGITGVSFAALLGLLYKNKRDADKRITQLEEQADRNQVEQLASHKEMIMQYVELVKSKVEVLSKLTSCLESMNNTLERLEKRN